MSDRTFSPAISTARNYHRWVLAAFDGFIGSRVLEIGIGHGEFRCLLQHHHEYVGIDIDTALVEAARRNHPTGRYLVSDVASGRFRSDIGSERFETVMCFNVLEHVRDDRAAIANMLDVLQPGGHLLLFVPAFPFLYNELDRLAGHHRRYTCASLTSLIKKDIGTVELIWYFNSVGGLGWLLNRFVRHKSLAGDLIEGQIRFFDRVVCPLARIADGVTRRVFGQSIVAIVRRL